MQGKTISGYTLQRLLGTGGMAEVWYAENKIGKKAAVKLLLPKLCQDENVKSRFLTEAEVMVKLDHPNIRQVYDYGDIDGRPAIVMEYLDGDDMKARMKRGQHFTEEELEHWWNQLADALNYTHGQGIVHRDIKPGNVFVDNQGNIKLLDFGIAKVRESISSTQTGQKIGTLMYMSPEQVKDSKHIDFRTDAYSLAVSFVHLLTGKKPYDSDTSSDFEISEQIVYKPLDLSGVPAGWQGFLAPYLEKDPRLRPTLRHFESVAPKEEPIKVDEDERTIVETEENPVFVSTPKPQPKHVETPSQSSEPNEKPKSKKGLWIGLGVAAIAAVIVLLALIRGGADNQKEKDEAIEEIVVNTAYRVETVPNTRLQGENIHVSDPDGILSDVVKQRINASLSAIRDKADVFVVALSSIGEANPDSFATELANYWGIGDSSTNNGVLCLFVNDQRSIVLRTGLGMENILPDSKCEQIIEQKMIPSFRKGDIEGGLEAGTLEVVSVIEEHCENQALAQNKKEEDKPLAESPRYSDLFSLPYGLQGYFDYNQALVAAKANNKPIFLDFTGHGAVSNHEMEDKVWSDSRVKELLRNNYTICALYVDDKTALPEKEWYTSTYDGKVKKTIGQKNADFQISNFGTNAQPYYCLLDHHGNLLMKPRTYNLDKEAFVSFLKDGLKKFSEGTYYQHVIDVGGSFSTKKDVSVSENTSSKKTKKSDIVAPVNWTFKVKDRNNNEFDLIATAKIDYPFYIFSTQMPEMAPMPTSFDMETSEYYEVVGGARDLTDAPLYYDDLFDVKYKRFSGTASFALTFRKLKKGSFPIKGVIQGQAAYDGGCIPIIDDIDLMYNN